MSVDTRARRAAAALRDSVEMLPADPPGLPTPSRSRIVLAAAVVLLVAAVAVVAAGAGDEDAAPVAPVATDDTTVPRPEPFFLPEGMVLSDVEVADLATRTYVVALYGRPAAGGPVAGGDLGVIVAEDGTATAFWGSGGRAADAGPRRVTLWASAPGGAPGAAVSWTEAGLEVGLASHTLPGSTLLALAADARVVDGFVRLGALPEGFSVVAPPRPVLALEGTTLLPAGVEGRGVTGHVAATGATLTVLAVAATDEDEAVLRWGHGPARTVGINSRPARLASRDDGARLVLRLSDRVVLVVTGVGVGEDDVATAAASSTADYGDEATAAASSTVVDGEIVEEATAPTGPLVSTEVAVPGGTARVDLLEEGLVCARVPGGSEDDQPCTSSEDSDLAVDARRLADGSSLVYGAAPEEATVVVVHGPGGEARTTEFRERVFAFVVPASVAADRVEALDADGRVLEESPVDP